jgi:uncharacterized GH25 family protein
MVSMSYHLARSAAKSALPVLLASLAFSTPAWAHEFWIEPETFIVAPDAKVAVHSRIGQHFKGDRMSYIPGWITWIKSFDAEGEQDYSGRAGDIPTISYPLRAPGLTTIAYYSTYSTLVFKSREIFDKYIDYEGLDGLAEAHAARGLPDFGFREDYWRCAKTLITTEGSTDGEDVVTGMPAEFLALENAYADTTPDRLDVQLLWQGKPFANRQVNVFRKGEEERLTTVRTDADGKASIPTEKPGVYLISAVQITEAVTNPDTTQWESWWASLTWERR